MTGGDTCPICTSATKYQYIMEELVERVEGLAKKIDLVHEDNEIRDQKTNDKLDRLFKWVIGIVISMLTIAFTLVLEWGLSRV